MKKRTVLKIVFISATAALFIFIFIMSAIPADESDELSVMFGYRLCKIFKPGFNDLPEAEKLQFAAEIDHFVRKAAHFTEFTALGALLYADFYLFDLKKYKCVLLGFLSGAAVAASDEIHQIFVPGRAGTVSDVLLDCAGVVIGCLIALLVTVLLTRAKKRKTT